MYRKSRIILEYLHLTNVGTLELLFALTPMLSGFDLGSISMSILMWIILLLYIFQSKGRIRLKFFPPLLLFIFYWSFRSVYLIFADDLNINAVFVQLICFIAVFSLYPLLDIKKLRGSLNWVALIAMAGLLYQWALISTGNGVHPLGIPGLSIPAVRLQSLSLRPSSFFMEPAAYASFMIWPVALALMEKKYPWAIVMVLSIFLSTSTTGLILSFILVGMSVFGNKIKIKSIFVSIIIGIGLFFTLTHFQVFEAGVEKLEETDTEENVRLVQGRYIVSTMHPDELVFGASYSTAYKYCKSGRAPNVIYYGENVYVSTFWLLILLYGVIGLFLYLNIYWQIIKISRVTLPLITCLCAVMFSAGYALGGTYFFSLILLLVIARNNMITKNTINKY